MDDVLNPADYPDNDAGYSAFMQGEPPPVSKPRGFSDPEVLARAQATRAANREAREPIALEGEAPPEGTPKRGRPKGSTNKAASSMRGMELFLMGLHVSIGKLVAHLTKEPDLAYLVEIDNDEAKLLSSGVNGVMEQYKIKINEKMAAILNLCNALGAVYGPRAIAIGIILRRKQNAGTNQNTE